MNGRNMLVAGALIMLLGLCVVAGIGMSVYNMGVMQGFFGGGHYAPSQAVPPTNTAPSPYYGPVGGPFRHGLFGFIGPLLGILFLFFILRMILWPFRWHRHYRHWGGGPWGGPWSGGPGGGGMPPMFDEWHRQAHGQGPQQPGQGQPPSQQWQGPQQTPPWQTPPPPTAGPAPER